MRELYKSILEEATGEELERWGFEYNSDIPEDVYTYLEEDDSVTVIKGCGESNSVFGTLGIGSSSELRKKLENHSLEEFDEDI